MLMETPTGEHLVCFFLFYFQIRTTDSHPPSASYMMHWL